MSAACPREAANSKQKRTSLTLAVYDASKAVVLLSIASWYVVRVQSAFDGPTRAVS